MFESNTYDAIQERVLARIASSIAKNEGSFIYTATAPLAAEEVMFYAAMDRCLDEIRVDKCSREMLIARAAEQGLKPHEATAAVWTARIEPQTLNVGIGARFNCGSINLQVTGRISEGLWELTSETEGTIANTLQDELVPIGYINGLEDATLEELIDPGTDEEDTEDFRERYLIFLRTPAASGNVHDYYNWAMSVDGVGAAKVDPLWDGEGTVRIVIVDDRKRAATEALCDDVYDYIEERRPVGAHVTIQSGVEVSVNVTARVRMKSGYSIAGIQAAYRDAIAEYLEEHAFESSATKIATIQDLLYHVEGVDDYDLVKINGSTQNMIIEANEVAVIGTVQLEAVA